MFEDDETGVYGGKIGDNVFPIYDDLLDSREASVDVEVY